MKPERNLLLARLEHLAASTEVLRVIVSHKSLDSIDIRARCEELQRLAERVTKSCDGYQD